MLFTIAARAARATAASTTRRTVAHRLVAGAGVGLAGVGLAIPLVAAAGATAAPAVPATQAATPTSFAASVPVAGTGDAGTSAASAASTAYTVVEGDWLSSIADRQHVAGGWQRLFELNRSTLTQGADMIFPGQRLSLGGAFAATHGSGASSDTATAGDTESAAPKASAPAAAPAVPSVPSKSAPAAPARTKASKPASTGTASGIAAAVAFARAQIGDAYVFGGTNSSGWDCSGLTQAALAKAGISVPRVAAAQAAASTHVPLSSLRAGDLLFWSSNSADSGVYHAALYIGGGQYIEAANPSAGVKYDTVANWAPDFAGRIA